jgi:hypothetical protein
MSFLQRRVPPFQATAAFCNSHRPVERRFVFRHAGFVARLHGKDRVLNKRPDAAMSAPFSST